MRWQPRCPTHGKKDLIFSRTEACMVATHFAPKHPRIKSGGKRFRSTRPSFRVHFAGLRVAPVANASYHVQKNALCVHCVI